MSKSRVSIVSGVKSLAVRKSGVKCTQVSNFWVSIVPRCQKYGCQKFGSQLYPGIKSLGVNCTQVLKLRVSIVPGVKSLGVNCTQVSNARMSNVPRCQKFGCLLYPARCKKFGCQLYPGVKSLCVKYTEE